jgi:hypothetical protein
MMMPERRLQLGVLVEIVEDDFRHFAARSSMTMRMPSRSDSSRRSEMPSIVFSRAARDLLEQRFLLT